MVCQSLFFPRHFSAEQEGFEKHIPQLENHLEQHLHPTYRNHTTLPWRGETSSPQGAGVLVWQEILIFDRTSSPSVPARDRSSMEWGCPLVGCPQLPQHPAPGAPQRESTGMNKQATVLQAVQARSTSPCSRLFRSAEQAGMCFVL